MDTSLPKALQPRPFPRLSRLAAYYMCFAKQHEQEFIAIPNARGSVLMERSAEIMYLMMAKDRVEIESSGQFKKPLLMLMPEGDLSFEARLKYYYEAGHLGSL